MVIKVPIRSDKGLKEQRKVIIEKKIIVLHLTTLTDSL